MDRRDLDELLQVHEWPAVTLVAPLHPTDPQQETDPLTVKRLVAEAERALHAAGSRREAAPVLEHLGRAVADIDWQHADHGVALFATTARHWRIDLPERPDPRVAIGATLAVSEVARAVSRSRRYRVLVLTERTEHLDAIEAALGGLEPAPFVLHGRMSRKARAALVAALDALPPDAPRVLLSTGKLVGEGFDHPPLDTLVLAMPVSWKGTLQQYAGRLHREHASKTDVRIIDFVDTGHPALLRMWDKRQRGYRAMGYRIEAEAASYESDL